jgi:hypothetical protein
LALETIMDNDLIEQRKAYTKQEMEHQIHLNRVSQSLTPEVFSVVKGVDDVIVHEPQRFEIPEAKLNSELEIALNIINAPFVTYKCAKEEIGANELRVKDEALRALDENEEIRDTAEIKMKEAGISNNEIDAELDKVLENALDTVLQGSLMTGGGRTSLVSRLNRAGIDVEDLAIDRDFYNSLEVRERIELVKNYRESVIARIRGKLSL